MTASYHDTPSDEESDIGTLWQESLIRYYEESGTDLRALPASRLNMDHIKAEQEHQLSVFGAFRHDSGKLDKLRSLISTNSAIVIKVATHVATAASAAFPPSAAILTAFNYVMNASRAVSDDYDMIISFFDVMNSFLERVSMLESRMPGERPFRRFLVNVFSAMMTLSAIARKCRMKGRLSRWAKALIDGSDPKLKGAFDSLHMHLQRFESVAMLTTLKHTLDSGRKLDTVGRDVKLIQAGVEHNIVISQQSYAVGLESRGHAMDAASTSHDILTVVTRQEERGAEYTAGMHQVMKTLKKMAKPEAAQDQVVDAGARKSLAMRALETHLNYSLDDKVDLADLESHYAEGTCIWFRSQKSYIEFEAGNTRLLWLSGPAGMGKSTLAYTVVKALQEEFLGDANTSVAHFFFREENHRVYAWRMMSSCALQIASRDNSYREKAVADIQAYEREWRDSRFATPLIDDLKKMWELLFQAMFTKTSGRRLVLVLDGLDEAFEKDRGHLETILEMVSHSEDMNIQVLFTSDPVIFTPDPEAIKVETFEMTKEVMRSDIRTVIIGRLNSLDRLRRLPQRIKSKIVTRLLMNADSKLPSFPLIPLHSGPY
ncbi:AAA family ATPase [Candidatus Bathyarchaeota archaeon]|nr:AAA family ATPase [Candidatus Bathyarchaeota archaeon]